MTYSALVLLIAILCEFIASPIGMSQQFGEPSVADLAKPEEEQKVISDAASDTSWRSYELNSQNSVDGIEMTKNVVVAEIIAPSTDYTYASFGKPSPFVPPVLANHFSKLEIPIVSILQRYKLNTLKLVGVWTLEDSARKALVVTQENEGVTVQVGDHIGDRGGKIIRIGPSSIKVREFNLAPDGSRQFNDRDLNLGDEDGSESKAIVIKSSSETGGINEREKERLDFLDTTDSQENRAEAIRKNTPPIETSTPQNTAINLSPKAANLPEITQPASNNLEAAPLISPVGGNQTYHPQNRKNNSARGKKL